MTWFADLSPCLYFGAEYSNSLSAIGWLERGRSFPTGLVEPKVYARLVELLKDPWPPGIFMGFHRCDLCLYEGETGKRNLFVPTAGVVFVFPKMITHYMNAHGYRPPEDFCCAVLACPPMRSMPYLKGLLAWGSITGPGACGRVRRIPIIAPPLSACWSGEKLDFYSP